MIGLDEKLVADWLPRQRWFGAKDRDVSGVTLSKPELLRDEWPLLIRTVATVELGGKHADYQLLVGVRQVGEPVDFLHGRDEAVLGEVDTDLGPGVAYDAVLDGELALLLLPIVVPGESAGLVRPLAAEQSNTSLVYDDRIIVKLFRQLAEGPNLDVVVTSRLAQLGFPHVARTVGVWEHDGRHLAVAQEFLVGGTDGWSLALTSLRDLFAMSDTSQMPVIDPSVPPPAVRPGDAGGDFAAEAERLGVMTADLHIAMAEAFGREPADLDAWAVPMRAQLARTRHPEVDEARIRGLLDRLGSVRRPGAAIRIHGDYHLGQAMRTDSGWYVLDFEGEPARPLAERQATSSPLKDVAGMLRSFHYAAQVALRERGDELDGGLADLADKWEARNRQAFLDGYLPRASEADLLPGDPAGWSAVLDAFELDKAVYELAYEMSHRPEWVGIPLAAIKRILEA